MRDKAVPSEHWAHRARHLLCVVALLGTASTARGNVVWPALIAENKVNSIPIIALSLTLEYLVIRWLFAVDPRKAIVYTAVANLASGLLGMVLRPLTGIGWEITLGGLIQSVSGWGTFNPVTWVFVPILGGAVNTAIELGTIRLLWKEGFTTRRFLLLWAINGLTVGLATAWVIFDPPAI